MKMRFLLPLLGLVLVTAGCANTSQPAKTNITYAQASANPLISVNYAAADQLLAQLNNNLGPNNTLIIATLANIDQLESSSTLGRIISEQVSSRFTQSGYRMVELKFRNSLYISQGEGELMLTRQVSELANAHDAQAVIVGTYAQGSNSIFVNLKVVQPNSNIVLAVHDYVLPLDENNRQMMRRAR